MGLAVASTPGVAWAAPESVDNLAAPGAPGSPETDDTTTEPVKTQPTVSITTDNKKETEITPGAQSLPDMNTVAQSTTAPTRTSPIAPNVVFRSSAGALTSERYLFPPATRWQSPLKPRAKTTTLSAATKNAGAQQDVPSPVTNKIHARNLGSTSVEKLDSTVADTAELKEV